LAKTTRERGADAEALAADYLTHQGYRLVARNYRTDGGEIDLVAFEGETLCFVEVRSLKNPEHGDPLETITGQKIARIIKAASAYIEALPPPWPAMRFDAVGILMGDPPQIRLVREAFEA
jgi:putative endonuclease